jgi:hypothetical protein
MSAGNKPHSHSSDTVSSSPPINESIVVNLDTTQEFFDIVNDAVLGLFENVLEFPEYVQTPLGSIYKVITKEGIPPRLVKRLTVTPEVRDTALDILDVDIEKHPELEELQEIALKKYVGEKKYLYFKDKRLFNENRKKRSTPDEEISKKRKLNGEEADVEEIIRQAKANPLIGVAYPASRYRNLHRNLQTEVERTIASFHMTKEDLSTGIDTIIKMLAEMQSKCKTNKFKADFGDKIKDLHDRKRLFVTDVDRMITIAERLVTAK